MGGDKDARLKKVGDPYYNKPLEYAMAIYSYYLCFKCKKPYFGGRKDCERLREEAQNNQKFKPEELMCPDCVDIHLGIDTNINNCKIHGKEFIEWKCKFCCSIA